VKELVDKVAADAGITTQQAEIAANTISRYIKDRTPAFFHEQLDVILNGGTLNDAVKKKFDDLKDELEEAAKNFGRKAEEFAEDVGKKVNDIFKKK
jgi:uncharacterized membrane-anchored protein YjiN (DUF445 family)